MLQKFILVFNIIAIAGTVVFFYGVSAFNIKNISIFLLCVFIGLFAKYIINNFIKVSFIKMFFSKGSSWMKKAPSNLSVCILKVLVYLALSLCTLYETRTHI